MQKRWRSVFILAIFVLTLYNILPTVFYYAAPLKSPVDEKKANDIAFAIAERVNSLQQQSIDWTKAFCKLLSISPESVQIDSDAPSILHVRFSTSQDALKFRKHFDKAGSLIPFAPATLSLVDAQQLVDEQHKVVSVQRKIPIYIETENLDPYFSFVPKKINTGINPQYRNLVEDRLAKIALSIGGASETADYVQRALNPAMQQQTEEYLSLFVQDILKYQSLFSANPDIAAKWYAFALQGAFANIGQTYDSLASALEKFHSHVRLERIELANKKQQNAKQEQYLSSAEQQRLEFLQNKETQIQEAMRLLKTEKTAFLSAITTPWTLPAIQQQLASQYSVEQTAQTIDIGDRHPLISAVTVDYIKEEIHLSLHKEIETLKESSKTEKSFLDSLNQLIYHTIAQISATANETITPETTAGFKIKLSQLQQSQSLIVFHLDQLAKTEENDLLRFLHDNWHPTHLDLDLETFPIWDYETYQRLTPHQQRLGLLVYAPLAHENSMEELRNSSVYVIAKGLDLLIRKFSASPNSPQAKHFFEELQQLKTLLHNRGFILYSGKYAKAHTFSKDAIFESEDFYQSILKATRENFRVHGQQRYATLELSTIEQRLLTLNQIETAIHEDLLRWKDEYNSARVSMDAATRLEIPKPTINPLWSNLKLSAAKYFRGDERKILHWGLDLSGGKTVQIELRDQNNMSVTNSADIKQSINELYNRVNKMGVSEVSIRQEGDRITLDFPGSQHLSAADLVKASKMSFHVVNEKFNSYNTQLREDINQFLQNVWNEAVITNRKDIHSINQIAWSHLYGDTATDGSEQAPLSSHAKLLYEQGLRLANPQQKQSHLFNDSLSTVAMLRGDTFSDWHGQSHPLIITFNNFVIQGTDLADVRASYDPSKGNFLSFSVKGAQTLRDGSKVNPRQDLQTWTSNFSKERITSTPLAEFTQGRGWRMAVILNDIVISSPALESPLYKDAMISGDFTQREVNRLEADLKAGSLTFAPHILSEKNVSPELGVKDRQQGIIATIAALLSVVALMIAYYRFSGVIASVAVLLNLLIMWATLQNIQATLTLAGLAGIILTMGMAVDANVLIFERIREEFAISKKIASAVRCGYQKAFSAILDSNVTTIIAALILLHFDSGPIKGFAITLIIGIVSSMVTALFMTKTFFTRWVKNPKHQKLTMASAINNPRFNFLKYARVSNFAVALLICAGAYLFSVNHSTIFGLDFTGGLATTVELKPLDHASDYQELVKKALHNQGLTNAEFQVKELSPSNNIKIILSPQLERKGRPFHGFPLDIDNPTATHSYEKNPRLLWIVNALAASDLHLTPQSLQQIHQNWTSIGGQISDSMRNNAFIGLGLALLCILFYIALRFELKYALSATLCLIVDVLATLAIVVGIHAAGVPVQIDLNTIAALMTIIGYSLNDTIIIFDRIREDTELLRKRPFSEIVNHALNVTLSRTTMTSSTTLIVLLALALIGGKAIFGLTMVMIIGVIFGTFSSLFIASPLLLFFRKYATRKTEKPKLVTK